MADTTVAATNKAVVYRGKPQRELSMLDANKRIAKMRKRGVISDKQHTKTLAPKYGGEDQQPIDAASR